MWAHPCKGNDGITNLKPFFFFKSLWCFRWRPRQAKLILPESHKNYCSLGWGRCGWSLEWEDSKLHAVDQTICRLPCWLLVESCPEPGPGGEREEFGTIWDLGFRNFQNAASLRRQYLDDSGEDRGSLGETLLAREMSQGKGGWLKREMEMDGRKWEETSFVDCSKTICQAISPGNLSSELTSVIQGAPHLCTSLLFFHPFSLLLSTQMGPWKWTRVGIRTWGCTVLFCVSVFSAKCCMKVRVC